MDKQTLATENHNLIYGYAHKYQLDLDEYYDLLAIALMEAVEMFDIEKGALSTIAFLKMNQAVSKYKRKQRHKYLYEPYTYYTEQGYLEIENQDLLDYMNTLLTDKQQTVWELYMAGYSQSDIAECMGCTKQNIQQIITKCVNILKEELDESSS